MVIVHAFFQIKDNKGNDFLKLSHEIVENTKNEEGNISYDLFESSCDSNKFIMVEKWKDKQSLSKHEEFPYFKNFIQSIKELLDEPIKVEVFRVVEE